MVHRLVRIAFLCLSLLSATAHALTAERYELALRPNFETHVLEAHARIHFKRDKDRWQVLDLIAGDLQISSAALDSEKVALERTDTGWRIALTEAQANAAESWLDVDYSAHASEGLFFGDTYVYTAFHTCRWMPCAGNDLSRASIAISLDLPAGYRSVGSGQRVNEADTHLQHWEQLQPYPLYTLGFAAGRFTQWLDTASASRLRYLASGDDEAALRSKFKDSARILAFFEAKAGVALPPRVYTQVLVPGDVAQEASSFSIIGKRNLDPILEDPQEDWVIVHEMAHQWWGNLVTCSNWNEFWLNEGIVVFMTAAWKQERWGEAAYQRELELAERRWQRAKDAGFDKPLAWTGEYPNIGLRRAIQYSKGALFMSVLRKELGEAAFWDGLRRYTVENAGRSVSSVDLQSAMEASSGRSLQTLFKRWVY